MPTAHLSWKQRLSHPAVVFAVAWAVLLAVIFIPLFAGGVIANPSGDMKEGYVTRAFEAAVIHQWGEIPRWDPYIFGGLPWLGAMHGDQAYPISIALRAIFPAALGIGIGMVLHLWLGAVGMCVFLGRLRHSWNAAIVGATAYGIGGPLMGLLFPGHDGKIFVLGLLPWGLLAVLEAARTARLLAFAGWGLVLGLMLLTPHFQMAYYSALLIGAFLLFTLISETPRPMWWKVITGMALGSALGLAFAGAQLLPFLEYLPFSPRSNPGSTSTGWAYATSWAMPPLELIGTVWGGFNGWLDTYWGTNPFKLHSEYLGLLVAVLAGTAFWRLPAGAERRKVWFWTGAVIVGGLWSLGGATPFYHLPYSLLPGISKTRAAGMMWGVVSCAVAVLASTGFGRLEAASPADRTRWARRVGIVVGVAALLGAAMSRGLLQQLASPERQYAAAAATPGAEWGILLGAATVVAFAFAAAKASMPRWLMGSAAVLIVLDLAIQDHRFVAINPKGDSLFAADAVVRAMQQDAAAVTQPWRVVPYNAYMGDYLIAHRIRSILGYHGNELDRYDNLLGGKSVWSRAVNPLMWRLLAVRYILTRQPIDNAAFTKVIGPAPTWETGWCPQFPEYCADSAFAYRVPDPAPWAWVVPLALKVDERVTQGIAISPQFDPARVVLLPPDAPFGTTALPNVMPAPVTPPVAIRVSERQPGVYVLDLDGLTGDAVLVVSENWLPMWRATVDGRSTPVARGDGTFMAVQVPAQTKQVVLTYDSPADRRGRRASLAGFVGLLAVGLVGVRWRRRGPPAAEA